MTYCGKDCSVCFRREKLSCCGCMDGPGNKFGGDCVIAKCAADKGHETCQTCGFKANCNLLKACVHMAEERIERIKAEEEQKAIIAQKAPVLGKWLWVVFWLIIPGSIGGIMSNETMVQILPELLLPGEIIVVLSSLAYGGILLKLGAEEKAYKKAGAYALIAAVVGAVAFVIGAVSPDSGWALTFALPGAVIRLISDYNQYMAHSAVLTGVDSKLSDKWKKLWKWCLWLYVGVLIGIVLLLLAPILGLLALLADLIGIVVVEVLKLIYLYRTAKIFREYPVKP